MINDNPEHWTVRKMIIDLTPEQLLKAILSVSKIELGDNSVYIHDIKMSGDGQYWVIDINGYE